MTIKCLTCGQQVLMAEAIYNDPAVKGIVSPLECPFCNPRTFVPSESIPIVMSNPDEERIRPVQVSSERKALEALVPEALDNGWFYIDQQLVPPENDIRRTWAAMWKPIGNGKLAPHWLIDAPIKGWFIPNPVSTVINTIGIKDDEVIAAGGTKFDTGAVRSGDKNHVMYQLISPIGMRRMAETMKEGFDKYGAYNWERGMPIGDLLNHAIAHLYAFLSGIPSVDTKTGKVEDDLAHAAWNLFAAMHMEETHPELNHGLRPNKDAKPTQS